MTFFTIIDVLLSFVIGILGLALYQKNTNAICKSKRRLDGKTAIVTGGTTGIGLEIAQDFAHRGAKVIIACPFEEEGISAQRLIINSSGNENIIFQHLDLSSFDSVRKFAAHILKNEPKLDILVNNAGINNGDWLTEDGLNSNMQVNYIGPALLTLLLLPLLKSTGNTKEPSRIVNTTSVCRKIGQVKTERWSESTKQIWRSYADSKVCIALFTRELAKRIDSRVIVNVVDPGFVATAITTTVTGIFAPLVRFLISSTFKRPWEGAQCAIFAAVSITAAQKSGKCFYNCKEISISSLKREDKMGQVLWEKTLEVVKIDGKIVSLVV